MKKTVWRLIAVLVCMAMATAPVPSMSVFAANESGTCGDNLTWTFDMDTGVLTISGTGDMEDYELVYTPMSSMSVNVSGGAPWNSYEENIKTVVIEDGVTSIGKYAFYKCESLTSVKISDSVTSIGENTFYECNSLTSVTIPDGVTSIGESAFYECESLASVTIPEGVTSIGREMFRGCSSLTSVMIPGSVKGIGESAFAGCENLTDVTIESGVTDLGDSAFSGCSSLISVKIPDSVTSIGENTFCACESLASVTIPDGVTSIGDSAFCECESLASVTMPDSITYIGYSAFMETAYYNNASNWDDGVLYIGKYLIAANWDIEDCSIKSGTSLIASHAFSNADNLKSVGIPDSVTNINEYAFFGCFAMESVTIGNGVKTIGEDAFALCGLTGVTIPENVESIGGYAFFGCDNLTSVTINGNPSIARGVFEDTGTVIYGYSGSTAERYAKAMGNDFVSIGSISVESDEVRVTNTDELLAALRSYRTIILADGVYITDSSLDICAVDLTLKAENSGKAEILSTKDNQPVVYITYSQNVTFDGIIFGHESLPPSYSCDANDHKGHVIHAYVSDNIYVANCDLYGCGVIGVCCERVNGFKAENCVIRDCRDQIVSFSEGSYGEFVNCVMSGNAYDDEVSYYLYAAELYDGDISFDNCVFINNHSEIFSASENLTAAADEGDSITLNGCTFKNNAWDGEATLDSGVCLNGITWKVENDTLYIGYPLEFGDGTTIASAAGEVLPYSESSLPWKKLSYSNTVLAEGVTYSSDASDEITVELNGTKIQFDQPPVIINGRTMVPLRAIFEALGASVDWDGETMTVTAVKDAVSIKMTIGEDAMYVNGNAVTLDVAPQLVNSRTLVPARAVAEAFKCNVEWNNDTRTVVITY